MIGYKIVLKRRKDQLKRNDLRRYEYIIFGHFDGMDIIPVNSWEELSPVMDENKKQEIEWEFLDEFVIKGVCDLEKDFREKTKDKLFVVVSMLNLNDKIIELGQDNILKVIENQLEMSDDEYECKVLPTISYQDAVVIFFGNDLNKIKNQVEKLRSERIGSSTKAMVTDAYTIVGVNQKVYKEKKKKKELMNKIDVSIRIILESGVNVQKFWSDLKNEIAILSVGYEMKQMFGNSDIMIFLSGEEGKIFSLFIENGCLNPGSNFFKNNICQIRTSVHPLCEFRIEQKPEEIQESEKLIEKEQIFKEFWESIRKFFKENDKDYLRLTRNLSDMYKMYLSLIQSEHNNQLGRTLTKTFKIFMDNIKKNIETFQDQDQAIEREEDKEKRRKQEEKQKEFFKNICKAFELFKEYVFGFLQDLRRSDRMFIEESSLTHPSVASATKLVLFYDEYINELADKLIKQERRDGGDSRGYHFMILSGGTNDISTIDLFSYMDPWEKNLDKLIFVLIPERQLFDVQKTLFSLSHECAHFCGERNRNERKQCFIKSVSQYICIDFEKYGKIAYREYTKEKMQVLLKRYIDEQDIEKNFKDWINEESIPENVCEEIEEQICRQLEKEIEEKKKEKRDGCEFFVELNSLMKNSWENLTLENNFKEYIYSVFLEMFKNYFKKFRKKLNKKDKDVFSQIDFEITKCDYYLEKYKTRLEEEKDKENIGKKNIRKKGIWNELRRNVDSCFFKLYKTDAYNDVLKIISTTMKECYADIVAVQCRNVKAEEFIMYFVDDNLTLEKCFPLNLQNRFRTALDLEIIFGECGKLGIGTEQKLQELFKKKYNAGMRCKFNCTELIYHINGILSEFEKFDGQDAIKPLKEYLNGRMKETISGVDLQRLSQKGNTLGWKNILKDCR